jgi:Disulphide bond corrector protein DsbC
MKRILLAGLLLASCGLIGQQMNTPFAKPKQYVSYEAEEQAVKAGKRIVVEMRFRVMDGFHVNSHTPKSELLIPTVVKLDPADGVRAEPAQYPAGMEYSFSFEPGEKLDVYTGEFTVKVPVTAAAGSHTVNGTLHYQACDNAACYPPKTLPVQLVVTAK